MAARQINLIGPTLFVILTVFVLRKPTENPGAVACKIILLWCQCFFNPSSLPWHI